LPVHDAPPAALRAEGNPSCFFFVGLTADWQCRTVPRSRASRHACEPDRHALKPIHSDRFRTPSSGHIMMKPIRSHVCAALALISLAIGPADAHPHVWVTLRSEILYSPEGTVTGVRHAWTFDDMFSAYALQGIAHAKKGQYTRQELASLAQVNVESLKEYDYFTFARADGRKLNFTEPVDYWLEYKNPALVLHFTLPLKTPALAKALKIEVYDPTIFVDFEFAKDSPVQLSAAPAQCALTVDLPHEPTPAEQLKLSQLDDTPLDASSTYGEIFANKMLVRCP
jgi:ABC-type uncharacterized transport system substrate-binding protein